MPGRRPDFIARPTNKESPACQFIRQVGLLYLYITTPYGAIR